MPSGAEVESAIGGVFSSVAAVPGSGHAMHRTLRVVLSWTARVPAAKGRRQSRQTREYLSVNRFSVDPRASAPRGGDSETLTVEFSPIRSPYQAGWVGLGCFSSHP